MDTSRHGLAPFDQREPLTDAFTHGSYAGPVTNVRPRRRADAERNIDAIVAATADLLRGGGVPSMTEVATAAGVGRVTLYAHFPSREALLEEVVRRAIAETDQAMRALDLDADPPADGLVRMVRTSWSGLDRYRTVRAVVLAELGPQAVRDQHDRVVHHVERLITRGRADGTFRTDLPLPWLVSMFYAILHAAADEVEAGRFEPATALEMLISTLESLLRPGELTW